jgi:hypothetical protein
VKKPKRTTLDLARACEYATRCTDNALLIHDLMEAAAFIRKQPIEPIANLPVDTRSHKKLRQPRSAALTSPTRKQSIIKKSIPKTRKERREYFRKQFEDK